MMKCLNRIRMILVLFGAGISLLACKNSSDSYLNTESDSSIEAPKDKQEKNLKQGIENLEPVLTLDQALIIFFDTFETDNIHLYKIEFNKGDQENYRYFIDGWANGVAYNLELDVETTDIITKEIKKSNNVEETLELDSLITPKEAMDIAVEENKKEAVESWQLSIENNQMIYKIRFVSDQTQKVDALSGELITDNSE